MHPEDLIPFALARPEAWATGQRVRRGIRRPGRYRTPSFPGEIGEPGAHQAPGAPGRASSAAVATLAMLGR